ncbi:MAG: hypothetical protein ACOH1T_02755 [Microbacteriaceae bacterium]
MASSRSRFSPARFLVGLAAVVAVALAGGFIFVQFVTPRLNGPIDSLSYTQSKAVADFDGSAVTITDEKRIAEFNALRERFRVTPGLAFFGSNEGCTGGTSTDLTVTYVDGRTAAIQMYDCGDDAGFVPAATELFSGWRAAA